MPKRSDALVRCRPVAPRGAPLAASVAATVIAGLVAAGVEQGGSMRVLEASWLPVGLGPSLRLTARECVLYADGSPLALCILHKKAHSWPCTTVIWKNKPL